MHGSSDGVRPARRRALAVGAVAALSFVLESLVSLGVFRSYPLQMDEYSYWYQAKIFAQNRLFLEDPRPPGLQELYMVLSSGKLFSKYGPGFSLVLSLGERIVAVGIVNPVIAVLTALLTYRITARQLGHRAGLFAMVALATSSYFVCYGASLYSHTFTLFLSLAAFELALTAGPSSYRRLALLGATFGLLAWVRPLDALCAMAAVGIFQVATMRLASIRAMAVWSPISGAFILGFCSYNRYLTGHFGVSTYAVGGGEFRIVPHPGEGLVANVSTVASEYVERLWEQELPLLAQTMVIASIVVPVCAAIALFLRRSGRLRILFGAHFALLFFLYNFHKTGTRLPTFPTYGMRYWVPAMAGMAILATVTAKELLVRTRADWRRRNASPLRWTRVAAVALGGLAIWQLAFLGRHLVVYKERFDVVATLEADIERRCPGKSIVALACRTPPTPPLPDFVIPCDRRRNPLWDDTKIFVTTEAAARDIAPLYPDHETCSYSFQHWDDARR